VGIGWKVGCGRKDVYLDAPFIQALSQGFRHVITPYSASMVLSPILSQMRSPNYFSSSKELWGTLKYNGWNRKVRCQGIIKT
jgi:hypothetical protein